MDERLIADKERVSSFLKKLAGEMKLADFVLVWSDGDGEIKTVWLGDNAKCYGMAKIGEHTLFQAIVGAVEAEEAEETEDDEWYMKM